MDNNKIYIGDSDSNCSESSHAFTSDSSVNVLNISPRNLCTKRRRANSSSPPTRVSSWTKQFSKLHISYNNAELCIQEVFSKGIGFKHHLSDEQQDHLNRLQEIVDFTLTNEDFSSPEYKTMTANTIDSIKQKVSFGIVEWDKRVYVVKFIESLRRLLIERKKTEATYVNVLCKFAEMCLLNVENPPEQLYWNGLRGKKVTSQPQPDLRFRPFGLEETESETSVCIVQAAPLNEALDRVYGQHAGELLIDLFHLPKDKYKDSTELSIPGIIMDGTKVQFTMLTISKDHYEKLVENKDLEGTDQAVIYTSGFHDILNQRHRNVLMRTLISLNNMDQPP